MRPHKLRVDQANSTVLSPRLGIAHRRPSKAEAKNK